MPSRPMVAIKKRYAKEKIDEREFLNNDEELTVPKKCFSKQAPEMAERLLVQVSLEMELRMRHTLFAAFNVGQWPIESCDELRNYPTCTLSVPRPVFTASKHCASVDICHKRTLARALYRKRLVTGRTRYETAIKANRTLRAKEKESIYHTSLFEFAERLERHPDPYFHGSYDYYYSGGNMCVLPELGHVAHVEGNDMANLNISHFPTHKDYTVKPLRLICSHIYDEPSEIFELRPLRQLRPDRPNCFAVRQRNNITLQVVLPKKSRVKLITSFKSKYTPFISFAQSSHNAHSMVVSTMKQQVRWYDLNGSTPTMRSLYDLNSTSAPGISWNTVKSWRENTFLYANEQQLCMMDMRTTPAEWLRHGVPNLSQMNCDLITSMAVSEFSHLFYVGTNHKLHCLDARFLGGAVSAERSSICTWTHQLEHAPAFLETFRNAGSEFIALSSPVAGEVRICELTRTRNLAEHTLTPTPAPADSTLPPKPARYCYKSLTLPYQPPTLQEAYESARLAGHCLQPHADLQNRLRCCTTGLAFYAGAADTYAEAADALLLVATSNGDVFAHTIGERLTQADEARTNAVSDDMMAKYARQICELTQPPLNYTDVVDMRAMSKVFRCNALSTVVKQDSDGEDEENSQAGEFPLNSALEAASEPKLKPKRTRHLGRWQKSMHALSKCKDALVRDLLAVWDIDYEEDKDFRLSELDEKHRIKPDPDSIVNSWLNQSTQTPAQQPMASIPIANIQESIKMDNSMNLGAEHGDVDMMELNDSTFIGDNSINLNAVPQSTQLIDEIVGQMDASALQMQQNTSALGLSMTKSKIKKKKAKYVKGF